MRAGQWYTFSIVLGFLGIFLLFMSWFGISVITGIISSVDPDSPKVEFEEARRLYLATTVISITIVATSYAILGIIMLGFSFAFGISGRIESQKHLKK